MATPSPPLSTASPRTRTFASSLLLVLDPIFQLGGWEIAFTGMPVVPILLIADRREALVTDVFSTFCSLCERLPATAIVFTSFDRRRPDHTWEPLVDDRQDLRTGCEDRFLLAVQLHQFDTHLPAATRLSHCALCGMLLRSESGTVQLLPEPARRVLSAADQQWGSAWSFRVCLPCLVFAREGLYSTHTSGRPLRSSAPAELHLPPRAYSVGLSPSDERVLDQIFLQHFSSSPEGLSAFHVSRNAVLFLGLTTTGPAINVKEIVPQAVRKHTTVVLGFDQASSIERVAALRFSSFVPSPLRLTHARVAGHCAAAGVLNPAGLSRDRGRCGELRITSQLIESPSEVNWLVCQSLRASDWVRLAGDGATIVHTHGTQDEQAALSARIAFILSIAGCEVERAEPMACIGEPRPLQGAA